MAYRTQVCASVSRGVLVLTLGALNLLHEHLSAQSSELHWGHTMGV